MKKKTYIKTTTLGIICILLCSMILTTAVSGEHITKLQQSQTLEYNEPISSETVDIKIQLSGSTENEVSVTLTQEQAAQFEQRIQLFKQQLEQSQTDKQTTQVFIDMIHYLNDHNMLPSHLSVQQAIQQVLAFNQQNKRMGSLFQQINPNTIMDRETDNSFCLVAGKSTQTHVRPYSAIILLLLSSLCRKLLFEVINQRAILKEILDHIEGNFHDRLQFLEFLQQYFKENGPFQGLLFNILFLTIMAPFLLLHFRQRSFSQFIGSPLAVAIALALFLKPLTIASNIVFGIAINTPWEGLAKGWLFTAGLQGIKSRDGAFYGIIRGFSGIKIRTGIDFASSCFYFGSAIAVRIE